MDRSEKTTSEYMSSNREEAYATRMDPQLQTDWVMAVILEQYLRAHYGMVSHLPSTSKNVHRKRNHFDAWFTIGKTKISGDFN